MTLLNLELLRFDADMFTHRRAIVIEQCKILKLATYNRVLSRRIWSERDIRLVAGVLDMNHVGLTSHAARLLSTLADTNAMLAVWSRRYIDRVIQNWHLPISNFGASILIDLLTVIKRDVSFRRRTTNILLSICMSTENQALVSTFAQLVSAIHSKTSNDISWYFEDLHGLYNFFEHAVQKRNIDAVFSLHVLFGRLYERHMDDLIRIICNFECIALIISNLIDFVYDEAVAVKIFEQLIESNVAEYWIHSSMTVEVYRSLLFFESMARCTFFEWLLENQRYSILFTQSSTYSELYERLIQNEEIHTYCVDMNLRHLFKENVNLSPSLKAKAARIWMFRKVVNNAVKSATPLLQEGIHDIGTLISKYDPTLTDLKAAIF